MIPVQEAQESRASAQEPFREEAAALGLDFQHLNGSRGDFMMAEVMGPGVALLDYDRDGDLDILLRQGGSLTGEGAGAELFRNELIPSSPDSESPGRLRFQRVTAASGLEARGYGMGVAVGDIDGDGWLDLYLTNLGANELWRNRGDGSFENVTTASGTGGDAWSVGASFVDYDRDGDLDLFVGNYVDFSLLNHHSCYHPSSARDYCGPDSYGDVTDRLYRNRGDGTFEDVTAQTGLGAAFGAGLGTLAFDADGDGWPDDLYVANDADENLLWLNRGNGIFGEAAVLAGCAVNGRGEKEASMGIAAGDFDGDGDEDLFLTHLDGETHTLYRSSGGGVFADGTGSSGLAAPSVASTCFGVSFLDFDNDGALDLFTACGAVKLFRESRRESPLEDGPEWGSLKQRNALFRNRGDGSFSDVTASAGEAFRLEEVSRGAAFGDLDNDGDTDVVIANNGGPARLLINQVGDQNFWVGIRPLDPVSGLEVIGARVEIKGRGGHPLLRVSRRDGSYASAHDPRLLFGLGEAIGPLQARVTWPGGEIEEWRGLEPRRYHDLLRGGGEAVP